MKLSIRLRLARSNGSYGASTDARAEAPTHTTTINVDTTATGERRNA